MKLILSRKGFDSGSGGCFSPYDHETGKYIWFPIPEKVTNYSNSVRYTDVLVKNDYISNIKGSNLSEIYSSLKGSYRVKLRKKEFVGINDDDVFAHFDPMLGTPPWIEENPNLKIGRGYGQYNSAPHLEKHNVNEGSIFLFFGGFQSTKSKKISGHYIYGWLKVKKRIETYKECKELIKEYNLHHHPHITEAAFNRNQKNYIFVPDEWLFEDLQIPGCGYFTSLNDDLLLSNNKEANIATWKLPSFFYHNLTQVHQKTWEKTQEDFCTVKTGIGQEFVTNLSKNGEDWLRELFTKNQTNVFQNGTAVEKIKIDSMDFREYLTKKHILKRGEKELKPISVEQYINRLENMRKRGIYNEEKQIDLALIGKIQNQYSDWKTYKKTIEHYLAFKTFKSIRM